MKEIDFLQTIIRQAYKICIKDKQRIVTNKDNNLFAIDCVTNCDIATEKYLISQIKKNFPNDRIVSEEFNSNNVLSGRCWVLDPIDGTVCFSNNIPIWCIQSAFVIDGECKFAVIYCPTIDEMYVADDNGLKINGKEIIFTENKLINECIVNIGDLVQKNKKVFDLQLKMIKLFSLKCNKVKFFGSSGYEFCMVASGRCQAYVLFGNNIWDTLPGSFICKKTGLTIINSNCNGIKITIACSPVLTDLFNNILKDI